MIGRSVMCLLANERGIRLTRYAKYLDVEGDKSWPGWHE